MSSPIYVTGKTTKKMHKNDLWQTPLDIASQCTDILVKQFDHTNVLSAYKFLDAGSHSGVWGTALNGSVIKYHHSSPELTGIEIDEQKENPFYDYWFDKTDYLNFHFPSGKRVDVVFGNPPFSLFEEFYEHTVNNITYFATGKIAWLLPLSYLHGKKRYDKIFSNGHLKEVHVFTNRIKWTGSSPHDQHAFFIWDFMDTYEFYRGYWI